MKMILMLKGGREAMLKAMGNEVRTGKYYNKAGKVALHIHGKNNYHFDYSKGGKKGHAEHSRYGKMTSGLKHQSEFQKQASKSKGKVVKIHAGTHAEKRRDKKGRLVTRHVSNKPKVKGHKQSKGSKVNETKPAPKQTGKAEPVANRSGHITLTEGKLIKDVKKDSTHQTIDGFSIHVPKGKTIQDVKKEGAIEAKANAKNELKAEAASKDKTSIDSAISGAKKHLKEKPKKQVYFDGATGKKISKKKHDAWIAEIEANKLKNNRVDNSAKPK